MGDLLLPEAQAAPSVYIIGAIIGCASALLCTTLISRCMPASPATAAEKQSAAALPVLSRRERAERMLDEMRTQRVGAAGKPFENETSEEKKGDEAGAADREAGGSSGSSSSWASTTEDDSDEEEEVDSEYERMDDLRLKMVFVVRHPLQPKMSAQEVAVLTASAGVQLVELQQRQPQQQRRANEATAAPSPAESPFVPTNEDQQRWLHWYLWWNRIGCAKVTLRCPDRATMDAVLTSAREMRLPVVQLHRSQFSTLDGVIAQGSAAAAAAGDEVVVLALGPAPSDVLEPVTGALKLFS